MASVTSTARGDPALAARLRREIQGEVLFDAFNRGRYSTDASIYQIEPIGVVVPKSAAAPDADAIRASGRGIRYTRAAFAYVFQAR